MTTEAGGAGDVHRRAHRAADRRRHDPDRDRANAGRGHADRAIADVHAENWNAPQTVTVTGVDDAIADGIQPYTIVLVTGDERRPGVRRAWIPDDVASLNIDNDSAGYLRHADVGPQTTEAGGTDHVHRRAPDSQPTADVTIAASSSSDTTEAHGERRLADVHAGELERAADRDGHRRR